MSQDRSAPAAFEALALPPSGPEHGGCEVLRAAIAEGNLLRGAGVWENRLADLAPSIGRIDAREGRREEDVVEKVRASFTAETKRPTDIGSTNAIR